MHSDRTNAILIAKDKLAKDPLFLDTETTGLDQSSEIVEICIIDNAGTVLLDSLVKPSGMIPADATRVHTITNTMVQTEPDWKQVWQLVMPILSGREVGIYNSEFDLRMIRQSNAKSGIRWQPDTSFFCIMKLYAQFYGSWNSARGSYRWQSLDAAGRQSGIPLPNTHRAKDDTLLARSIFIHIANSK